MQESPRQRIVFLAVAVVLSFAAGYAASLMLHYYTVPRARVDKRVVTAVPQPDVPEVRPDQFTIFIDRNDVDDLTLTNAAITDFLSVDSDATGVEVRIERGEEAAGPTITLMRIPARPGGFTTYDVDDAGVILKKHPGW